MRSSGAWHAMARHVRAELVGIATGERWVAVCKRKGTDQYQCRYRNRTW